MTTTKTLTPFLLADAIYYRLGKSFATVQNKQERGLTFKQTKCVLDELRRKGWSDVQILNLIDEAVFYMKQAELPLVYRMLYSVVHASVFNNKYVAQTNNTGANYSLWIQQEVDRLKNIQ